MRYQIFSWFVIFFLKNLRFDIDGTDKDAGLNWMQLCDGKKNGMVETGGLSWIQSCDGKKY